MAKVRVKTQKELVDVCKEKGYSYSYCKSHRDGKDVIEVFESDDMPYGFVDSMNEHCGQEYNVRLNDKGSCGIAGWNFSKDMIEVLEEDIAEDCDCDCEECHCVDPEEEEGITYKILTYGTYIEVVTYEDGMFVDTYSYEREFPYDDNMLVFDLMNALKETLA